MSKKTLGAVVIALALMWSGAAFGQAEGADVCAGYQKVLTFPYLTSAGDFASGVALINLSGTNIPPADVCFYARTSDGQAVEAFGDAEWIFRENALWANGIPARGILTTTLDAIAEATDNDRWTRQSVIMGVYVNNANDSEAPNVLRGFAMLGDGAQAQSYNAINQNAAEGPGDVGQVRGGLDGNSVLTFDYSPRNDSGWNTGLAISNVTNAAAEIRVDVFYGNGGRETAYIMTIPARQSLVGPLFGTDRSRVFPGLALRDDRTMRIVVTTTTLNARLHGFSFFGDGTQGQGLLPVYSDTDADENYRPDVVE